MAAAARWGEHLSAVAHDGADFDTLVLRARSQDIVGNFPLVQAYAVGWSDTQQSYAAFAWAPWTDWQPVEVSGWHLQPHPYGLARGDDLLDRRLAHEVANGTADTSTPFLLPDGPKRQRPQSVKDWQAIVRTVRATRAVKPKDMRLRNPLGGTITRTTLTRAGIKSDLIAVLDDPYLPPAPDFAAMFTGTEHPSFQLGPCVCGSRRPLTDCHGMTVAVASHAPAGPASCSRTAAASPPTRTRPTSWKDASTAMRWWGWGQCGPHAWLAEGPDCTSPVLPADVHCLTPRIPLSIRVEHEHTNEKETRHEGS